MFVIALVLLFIVRLRFPRGSSIANILTQRYGRPVLILFREVERHDFKKRKLHSDLRFLKCCKKQNLVPNFLKFKVSNRNLQQSKSYRKCQQFFLNTEIKNKEKQIKYTSNKHSDLEKQLKESVSWIDFTHLSSLIEQRNVNSISRVYCVQTLKLRKLGYNPDTNLNPDKVIYNLSNHSLTNSEKSALSNGLKYVIHPTKPKFVPHFLNFEKLFKTLKSHDCYKQDEGNFNFLKSSLKHTALVIL